MVPYQCWMTQRIEKTILKNNNDNFKSWLKTIYNGKALELYELPELLSQCRTEKIGGLIYSKKINLSKL